MGQASRTSSGQNGREDSASTCYREVIVKLRDEIVGLGLMPAIRSWGQLDIGTIMCQILGEKNLGKKNWGDIFF